MWRITLCPMVACVLFSSYFAYGEGPQDVLMGMQIERIDHNTVAPRVVTTGAEFLLQEDARIHCFQRIPKHREVARIERPSEVLPLKLEPQNDFRCLVAGQGLHLVIQGDSLVILKARRNIKLAFEGRFTPVYHAGTDGESGMGAA